MFASSILGLGLTITRTRKEGVDEALPDAKQQELDGSKGEFRNLVANLLDFVKEVQHPKHRISLRSLTRATLKPRIMGGYPDLRQMRRRL
jgi:hypothetical protein